MGNITAADLLVGSDEDFVINLYLAALDRWPDPEGFAHMMAKVVGSEAARAQAITDLLVSPEAMLRGRPVPVQDPLLPAEPIVALQRQLALRTRYLLDLVGRHEAPAPADQAVLEAALDEARADMAALRSELRQGMEDIHRTPRARDEVEPLLREARAEMAALRRELRERLADSAEPMVTSRADPDIADYMNDLMSVAEARMEIRIRALEKRLP